MEKLIFSADLHGNLEQYEKILNYARQQNVDIIAFGGDLTPKDSGLRTPKGQRDFLENQLFPLFKNFRQHSDIPILLIMGNDDFISNRDVFVQGQKPFGYQMIDVTPYVTKSGYSIVGYNYIPSTPFKHKCWERRDREQDIDFSDREDTRLEGVISQGDELVAYNLNEALSLPSIEADLETLTKGMDTSKLILISHSPPYDTVCDFCVMKKHVGSKALKAFIENKQPYLTLHGHIHETVDLTGAFIEKIGTSSVVTVGNDHRPRDPYIIEAELNDTPACQRLQIQS